MACSELILVSRILRARLAQKALIDCSILTEQTLLAPKTINEHLGRFCGFFTRRPHGDICFFLFARSDPMGDFDHVFGYYVNKPFFHIPASEKNLFIAKCTKGIKETVMMVKTGAHELFHHSVLVQMIVFTLNVHIFQDSAKKYRVLKDGNADLFLCYRPDSLPIGCDPNTLEPRALSIWRSLKVEGVNCTRYVPGQYVDKDVELLAINFKGHLVYGINYGPWRAFCVLLPHTIQFNKGSDVAELKRLIMNAFENYEINHIVASRIYADTAITCNGLVAIQACVLALKFPFVSIREFEMDAIMDETQLLLRPNEVPGNASEFLRKIPREQSQESSSSYGYNSDSTHTSEPIEQFQLSDEDSIIVDVGSNEPVVSGGSQSQSSQMSSQATIIMSADEVQALLDTLQMRREAKDVLSLPYPVDNGVIPMDDPKGTFLLNKDMFVHQVKRMVSYFVAFTTAATMDVCDSSGIGLAMNRSDEYNVRFLVVPIVDPVMEALIVIDRENEEWGFIDSGDVLWRHPEVFATIKTSITKSAAKLAGYAGAAINVTSYYHTNYPRIHLLMALFHIGKAFRYASILPRKVIYREKDFRGFCHQLCHELEVANLKYNSEHGLIKSNGFLADKAYRSYPSPVQFDRAVVNEDQCGFCKRRGFKNLGAHMSMMHGGYGVKNRERRRWRESIRGQGTSS